MLFQIPFAQIKRNCHERINYVPERKHILLSFRPKGEIFKPYNFNAQKISHSTRNVIFCSFHSDTTQAAFGSDFIAPLFLEGTQKIEIPYHLIRLIQSVMVSNNEKILSFEIVSSSPPLHQQPSFKIFTIRMNRKRPNQKWKPTGQPWQG